MGTSRTPASNESTPAPKTVTTSRSDLTAFDRPEHVALVASKAKAKAKLIAPFEVRLENPDGVTIKVPATNYFLESDGSHRAVVKDLADISMARTPAEQAALGQRITSGHASAEMSFRVKDVETGAYDKVFEVPCHPSPVPLEKRHFDMLVASTGSVMRALREMLQVIYANRDATAEDLGLGDVPAEEQERVLETIKSTVYFEPKLVGPAMADYPFLTVGGFDAAVGDLDNPDPIFFEFNLGTPSGLSNNIQLQEVLRELDPEVYETIRDRLPADDTFERLAHAVSSNAAAWTQRDDGISVVIGPGVWNGAHPDVASIAHYSGMPLVNPSDLYEDNDGAIRLNTPNQEPHPVVTGIYGRLEESYFIQDCDAGLPIRDPHLDDNEALSKKLGVELEPGIVYHWEYDDAGEEIVGVKLDEAGKPRLMPVFESIGHDPSRPDAPRGSFANAITGRKLYYSGLGGRVVDDKRVFQVVSRYLAPRYRLNEEDPIARPPRTLDVSEYEQFYSSDDLARYVVKAPDRSGGDGVMLMCNLSDVRRREVVEEVRQSPSHFIVQELVPSAVMMAPEQTDDGEMAYGSLMTDWRLFSMMDADGNVSAGPNSLLLRVANASSASTNTSQGGGYGIGVILDEPGKGQVRKSSDSLLPVPPSHTHLTVSKQKELEDWLDLFTMVLTWADPFSGGALERIGNATFLADKQRTAMELIGRDFAPIMSKLRAFDKGEHDGPTLHAALLDFRAELLAHDDFPVAGVRALIHDRLGAYTPLDVEPVRGPAPEAAAALLEDLSRRPLDEPVETFSYEIEDKRFTTIETHDYTADNVMLEEALRRLDVDKGSVRHIEQRAEGEADDTGQPPAPYFRVENGRPIIGIDMSQPYAVSALRHQLAYLDVFEGVRARYLKDGLGASEASKLAGQTLFDVDNWVRAERTGIKSEMAADATDTSRYNRGTNFRPAALHDPGYAGRVNYADIEGLRSRLYAQRFMHMVSNKSAILDHAHRILHTAEKARVARIKHLEDRVTTMAWSTTPASRHERRRTKVLIDALKGRSAFDNAFDASALKRFEDSGIADDLRAIFQTAVTSRERPSLPQHDVDVFEAPHAVHTIRDSLDDAMERDQISAWARVILIGATAATAVQGFNIIHGPAQMAAEQHLVQKQAVQRDRGRP